jgi:AcrR family transcriptional regulator
MADAARAPRDRMVYSAAQLVRERGVAATGIRDVVERAAAPRGSVQHYFPGGKDQLVSEALLLSGDFAAQWVSSYVDGARRPTPSGLFTHMVAQWKREFTTRGFERGCPVNAAAAEIAGGQSPVNEPLRTALGRWEDAIVAALARMGIPVRRGRRLATVMLSALEGAILLARVHRDVRPLSTVAVELGPLLDQAHRA